MRRTVSFSRPFYAVMMWVEVSRQACRQSFDRSVFRSRPPITWHAAAHCIARDLSVDHSGSKPPRLPVSIASIRDRPLTTPYPTHDAARLDVRRRASAALQPVAEPHHPALQHLTAFERHSAERGWCAGLIVAGVEDARRTLCAVHGWENRQAELVDEARARKAPFVTPPPSSSTRCMPSSRFGSRAPVQDRGPAHRRRCTTPHPAVIPPHGRRDPCRSAPATIGSSPISVRPQAILPCASSTTPYAAASRRANHGSRG